MALLGTTTIHPHQGNNGDPNSLGLYNSTNTAFMLGGENNFYDGFILSETFSDGSRAGEVQDKSRYKQFLDNSIFTEISNTTRAAGTGFDSDDGVGYYDNHYLRVGYEIMRITRHYINKNYESDGTNHPPNVYLGLERGLFNTQAVPHYEGETVQLWDGVPENTNEVELTTQSTTTSETTFLQEEVSSEFGVPGIIIEQTLLNTFDPYSGMDIDTTIFQNTNQALEDSNIDGRIELGMFSFNDDNIASNNFPSVLGPPFIGITKTNMVDNGDCKFVEKAYYEESEIPIIVKPEGDWMFLSLHDITDPNLIQNYTGEDVQGFTGYGGRYAYVPLSLEQSGTAGINYWGNVISITGNSLSSKYVPTITQTSINNNLNDGALQAFRNTFKILLGEDVNTGQSVPHIAAWIATNEAYSNKKCLQFMNFAIWNHPKVYSYLRDIDIDNERKYPFNWLLKSEHQHDGEITSQNIDDQEVITENQYRVLNQVQKIYDKFHDEPLNPYSSLKIRFKMKTTHVFPPDNTISSADDKTKFIENPLNKNINMAPKVEVGILQSQFEEIPKSGKFSIPFTLEGEVRFKAPGQFNSQRYYNGSNFINKRESRLGGMSRFQNSIMNEWETFEFDYNLRNEHNNRGLIYGVPYGGSFDDEENNGPVEIMINHNTNNQDGLPVTNPGEIYFKISGYQEEDTRIENDTFYMITPDGNFRVSVKLGGQDSKEYMTVASQMGDGNNADEQTVTGEQPDGRVLEAYLMYVGGLGIKMNDGLDYGNEDTDNNPNTDMVVAYWDGERWSYDKNSGYNRDLNVLEPINNEDAPNCFILARLYSDDSVGELAFNMGITGIDQYIDNEIEFPTDGIGNLALFLQSGNNFQGRVLIDDIECFESYEFIPDVDVRKKKSVGNYGLADLTKYYDKDIQPNEYKDTQAPLEAQFYFYPQYPTDEIFVERTPIYQDFKMGRFYIYDIDWGDGTINEFTSKPEQIDENTALYHTYESNGVFEVNGTMIRVKTDRDDKIIGVAHNKKFKLRININQGNDEDFQYFGSDGYSFIPYKNTTPIIGGISNQSNYYKKTKRQIGFLNNEKISIEFKNKSDKLKTELALFKMENQSNDDLEVLPNYMIERFDNQGVKIYNGISPIKEELGKSIGDVDLTSIKYYNKPKSIWEMFGFEKYDFDEVGKPDEPRYWKNIIPTDYSIFNREGVSEESIDTYSEQEWLDDYYYPVLPKYSADGKFIEGNFPNNKIPFSLNGNITNEDESDKNLLINIVNEKNDVEVFNDKSGNKNYGFSIQDFNPKFDEKTLRVKKNKSKSIFKTSKPNGAF